MPNCLFILFLMIVLRRIDWSLIVVISVGCQMLTPLPSIKKVRYYIFLNLKKIFKVNRFRFSPGVDVFNILNRSDVIALNTRYGPSWQQPTNILQGRWIKFGAQLDF